LCGVGVRVYQRSVPVHLETTIANVSAIDDNIKQKTWTPQTHRADPDELNLVEVEGEQERDSIIVARIAVQPDFTRSLSFRVEEGCGCHGRAGACGYYGRVEVHYYVMDVWVL
jgi:hypothetical protein